MKNRLQIPKNGSREPDNYLISPCGDESGWSLGAANEAVERAFQSGSFRIEQEKLLERCLGDTSEEHCQKVIDHFKTINTEAFVYYWLPGGGLEAISATWAMVGALWLTDDLVDRGEFVAPNERLLSGWHTLPAEVDAVYGRYQGGTTAEELFDATVKRHAFTGDPRIDGHRRLIIWGTSVARVYGRDSTYYQWVSEAARWAVCQQTSTLLMRRLEMSQVDVDDLLSYREQDGATTMTQWFMASCAGSEIPAFSERRQVIRDMLTYSGLHVALANDILSHGRDKTEICRCSNFVEYQHLHLRDEGASLRATIRQCNSLMMKFVDTVRCVDKEDAAGQFFAASCSRMLRANILWSLEANRYKAGHRVVAQLVTELERR